MPKGLDLYYRGLHQGNEMADTTSAQFDNIIDMCAFMHSLTINSVWCACTSF